MDDQLEQLKLALEERYDVQQVLGEGGMAVVYLARDFKHDRQVAIKTLRPDLTASIGAERFLQEIRNTAKLSHPHILALYDSGVADGLLFYVMPFVPGDSLRALLHRQSQLPIEDATRIAREVAEALGHAHRHGLVHRDIKPENILLSEGHALVADFGISRAVSAAGAERLTQTGTSLGTPAYMSPEQAAGDPDLDQRTDVYSLGCVLYEMLVGQIPFPAPTLQAMMARHTLEPPPPPSVMRPSMPPALEDVVLTALAKNPVDRFAGGTEMAEALAAVESGRATGSTTVAAHTSATGGGTPAASRFHRRGVVMALVVLLAVVAALGSYLAGVRRDGPSTSSAAAAGENPIATLAVIPFDNVSDEPENDYFVAGLADELVDVLSDIDGVRVAGRRSTRAFRNTTDDPSSIGRALNVEAILEGSVQKSGDRVRITARLVDARDGFQLWSDRFDRTVDDIFAVQEEIARSLASALRGELQGDDMPTVEPLTANPMAHDKYLWGQFNLERRTEEGALDAIDNFTMSIGFDSAFAGAYVGLADARLALLDYTAGGTTSGQLIEARAAAETALRLNPELARARAALGLAKYRSFDWDGAEAEYVRALDAAPDEPVVRQRYAELLATTGRWEEALVHGRVAVERDPLSTSARHTLLRIQRGRRTNEEAISTGQEILALNRNDGRAWLDLGLLFLVEGRVGDAQNALERYAELNAANPEAFRSFTSMAAEHAQTGTAGRVPAEVVRLVTERPVQLAVFHQLAGDSASALSVLEEAHRGRHPDLTYLSTRPELAPLGDTPRLRSILLGLGVAPG